MAGETPAFLSSGPLAGFSGYVKTRLRTRQRIQGTRIIGVGIVAAEEFLGAVTGLLGAGHVNVLGTLSPFCQDGGLGGKHLNESPGDR